MGNGEMCRRRPKLVATFSCIFYSDEVIEFVPASSLLSFLKNSLYYVSFFCQTVSAAAVTHLGAGQSEHEELLLLAHPDCILWCRRRSMTVIYFLQIQILCAFLAQTFLRMTSIYLSRVLLLYNHHQGHCHSLTWID